MANQRRTGEKNTRQVVQDLLRELVSQGEDVGPTKVRQIIEARHGYSPSPNLVGEEVRNFWAKVGPELARKDLVPSVPGAVSEAFSEIWELSLKAADEAFQAFRDDARKELEVARNEAALREAEQLEIQAALDGEKATGAQLLKRLSVAEQSLVETQLELSRAQASLAEVQKQLSRSQEQLMDERRQSSTRSQEAALAHREEIERLVVSHSAEIARLEGIAHRDAEAWDGVRKHLLLETDRLREMWGSEVRALRGSLASAQEIEAALRTGKSSLEERLTVATARLKQREEDVIRLERLLGQLPSNTEQQQAGVQEKSIEIKSTESTPDGSISKQSDGGA